MGTTYTGLRVQDSYNAIIKIGDNGNLSGTAKLLSDALGNDSPIYLSTSKLGIGVSPSFQFQTSSNAKIGGNLTVAGNLTVNGTTTFVDSTIVEIGDNMIELAKDNTANTMDIGWYGTINSGGEKYVGMKYDAGSGVTTPEFHVGLGTVEPGSTAEWTVKGKLVIGAIDSTGGTFSGQITIPQTPTADGHAASKKYVDDHQSVEVAERVEITVKNVSGGSLAKGTIVHVSPSASPPSGNVIEVVKADYDDATKMPGIGVLNETIGIENEGAAVMIGAVSGIDTSSFSAGDELYVGNDGAFTNTKPTATNQLVQKIAVVIKVHASNGSIKVFGAGRSNDVPNLVDRDISFSEQVIIAQDDASDRILFTRSGHDSYSLALLGSQGLGVYNVTDNLIEMQFTGNGNVEFAGDVDVNGAITADDNVFIEGNTNPNFTAHDITNETYTSLWSGDSEAALTFNHSAFRITSSAYNFTGTDLLSISSSGVSTFYGSILPATDSSHDLGSASKRWDNIYADDISVDGTLTPDFIEFFDVNGNVSSRFKIYAWDDEFQITKRNLSTGAHTGTLLALDYTDNSATFAGDVNIANGSSSGDVTKLIIGATGGNAETHLQLAENFAAGNMTYGFSFVTDGNSSNNLLIKRHSNSTSGSTVITVNRDNDNVSFAGNIAISAGKKIQLSGAADSTHHIYHSTSDDFDIINYSTGFKLEHYQSGTQMTMQGSTGLATFAGDVQIDGGNLGIGTAPTSRNLSVFRSTAGSIANFLHYTDASNFSGLYINVSQADDEVVLNASGSSGAAFVFQQGNAQSLKLDTSLNATFAGYGLFQGSTGNAPTGDGTFVGSTNGYGNIQLNGTGGGHIDFSTSGTDYKGRIIYFNSTNALHFYTNVTERVSISNVSTFYTRVDLTENESLRLKGIRGQFTNEYIHMYNKVGIGHPSGWGQGNTETPIYGLSTYGGIKIGYGNNDTSTFYGHIHPSADSTYDLGSSTSYWRNIYADNVITEGGDAEFQKVYKDTVTINDSTYTTVATVAGNSLASAVRLNVSGVGSSSVINVDATIFVNHYRDILIKSTCAYYRRLYIKVVSDNNEDFAIELKKDSGGATSHNVNIEIIPLNSEEITITNSHSYSSLNHEHLTEYGESQSSNDADGGHDYHYWLKDDGAKLKLGAGQDLQIYHDGNNSFIRETGTGSLYIDGETSISLRKYTGAENMLVANTDGSVDLYFNNAKKFETYASGTYTSGNHAISSGSKLLLRGTSDGNHYLRYQATGFSNSTIDGPQLVGHQGGELGTNLGGDAYSLRWQNGGNVFVRNALTVYGSADLALSGGYVRVTTGSIGSNNAGTRGLILDGNYTNGQYRHRWRKEDKGGGVPLYLDISQSTANSFTQIARFGPYTNNQQEFEVYGQSRFSGDVEIGTYDTTASGYLFLNGSTANRRARLFCSNGNLHIDSNSGNNTYLNYYYGSGVAFGGGNSTTVAFMGPDGDLWKGSSDNSGYKYWHAGNDGSGSGLDADTLDGVQASSFFRKDADIGNYGTGDYRQSQNLYPTPAGDLVNGSMNPFNTGINFCVVRHKIAESYAYNGSSWADCSSETDFNNLLGGDFSHNWGGTNLKRSKSDYIMYMGNQTGYCFIGWLVLTHTAHHNTFQIKIETTETNPSTTASRYEDVGGSTGWSVSTHINSNIGSWPGWTIDKITQQIGGGADDYMRIRFTPNWASGQTTEISMGSLGMFASYGSGAQAASVARNYDINYNGSANYVDDKKVQLGDGNDLQLYHDGSNSYISDTNASSDLLIQSNHIILRSSAGENMIFCDEDGAVRLYHNNSVKLDTTTTGIEVHGNIMPSIANAYTIGDGTNYWNNVIARVLTTTNAQDRTKIRVWSSSTYGLGMANGFTYGHLANGEYAMTFQMNNNNNRGFWWGDDGHTDAQGAMSLTTNGRLTVATSISVGQGESITSPDTVPLYVQGGAAIGSKVMYQKAYGSLDTTGQVVAALTAGGNGASAVFVFECGGGGTGRYQKIVWNCINQGGTWTPFKDIDEGGNAFDVVSSGNGSTVTFTFKGRSSAQYYTPRVYIEAFGTNINTTYI